MPIRRDLRRVIGLKVNRVLGEGNDDSVIESGDVERVYRRKSCYLCQILLFYRSKEFINLEVLNYLECIVYSCPSGSLLLQQRYK